MALFKLTFLLLSLAIAVSAYYNVYEDPELKEAKPEKGDSLKETLFKQFIKKYNKQYRPDSNDGMYYKRFAVFKKNLKLIDKLNKYERGSAHYGITQFTDMTSTEFQQMKGLDYSKFNADDYTMVDVVVKGNEPDSYDWKAKGAVTEVKNQGQCGSCWAFSTTGNVEGQWFIKKGKLLSLSEQELLDCDSVDLACNGGLPSQAYKSIEKLGGLETESDYPYDAEKETCQFAKSKAAVYVNDSVVIPSNETQMAAWLYSNGPISIGINAIAMQFYFGGVSHPWRFICSPSKLDHGVLITGYGVTGSGEPYWNIKNSWGPNWGEEGYYRIYRGDGSCGVDQMPTSAIIN